MTFGYFGESIKLYTKQLAAEYSESVIEEALRKAVLETMTSEPLMKQVLNASGNVVYSYIDSYKANEIRSKATTTVMEAIDVLNEHEDFQQIELPLGYFFSRNIFLSNGIRVPIKLSVIGSHKTEIVSSIKNYGINSSVVEISIEVSISVQVAIPFQGSSIDSVSRIPLSIEIINSEVPKVYFGLSSVPEYLLNEGALAE